MTARKSRKSDIIYSGPINEVLLGGSNFASPQEPVRLLVKKKKKKKPAYVPEARAGQNKEKNVPI